MSVSGPCEPHQNCKRKRMEEEVGMEKWRERWEGGEVVGRGWRKGGRDGEGERWGERRGGRDGREER